VFVIGTAGHVDHGKSLLIEALTGIDPDRLREEKQRGMTIDLGFAWLTLPSGTDVSIVDVPGHERFIKNMLAGVGGVDLALLVVAADEGVMPQTREHLAILDLLGADRGVVALTKADLVDEDWLELVRNDVQEVIDKTSLAGSPIVACSAVTGQGLPVLLDVIDAKIQQTPPKRDLGRPRLPIDRAFTISGFGTVVTGTLIDGSLHTGQEVEIVPAVVAGHQTTLRTRLRGLQTHRSQVEVAEPGARTAANLTGLTPADLWRGQVLTTPGWLQPSRAVNVRLRVLDSVLRPLKHNLAVVFHSLASEASAKLILLEADEVRPGEETWAQIRLERPLAILRGDRFVLRDANDTIGGGTVVETQARRTRRRHADLESLAAQVSGPPEDVLYAAIASLQPVEPARAYARLDIEPARAAEQLQALVAEGRVVRLAEEDGGFLLTRDRFEDLTRRAVETVEASLRDHPLRSGYPKEELRSRLELQAGLFGQLLARWVADGVLTETPRSVAPPGWQPQPTQAQLDACERYVTALKAAPYSPPLTERPADELVAYLVDTGQVVETGDEVVFEAGAYHQMVDAIVEKLSDGSLLTVAQVRDLFGTSRRYVLSLLSYLDSQRITLRRGDDRALGPNAPKRDR
jgi:selenocysteine-specific elongation factor